MKEIFELRKALNQNNEILVKQTNRIHDLEKENKDIKTRHLSLRDLHVYELEKTNLKHNKDMESKIDLLVKATKMNQLL